MKKKLLLKIALVFGGTLSILSLILLTHIYMVTHQTKNDKRERQLSRIDFVQPLSSEDAQKIKTFVSGLNGVNATFINQESGTLVYTYSIGEQTSTNVFTQLMETGNYKAKPYTVDAVALNNGCPAMTSKSITTHLKGYLSKLF